MEKSDLTLYVSFGIICLATPFHCIEDNVIDNLCLQDDGLNILSIFNLKTDIILQTRGLNDNTSTLWQVSRTDSRISEGSISSNMKQIRFLDNFVDPVPHTSLKYTYIPPDKNLPIFGYVVPIPSEYWEYDQCINQTSPNITEEGCRIMMEISADYNKEVVCIHGKKNSSYIPGSAHSGNTSVISDEVNIFIYDSWTATFDHLYDGNLRALIASICWANNSAKPYREPHFDDLHNPTIVSVVNWAEMTYKSIYVGNITTIEYEDSQGVKSNKVRFLAVDNPMFSDTPYGNGIETWSEELDKSKYFHVFRFNSYYEYMVCGKNCTLGSRLEWISYRYTGLSAQIHLFDHRFSNITFKKLLGCSKFTPQPLNPNEFCDKKRKFISIFNLENDVYFQSVGRFWKYSSNGFTDHSNPMLSPPNKFLIHLDSEFGALLEKELYDTYYPVFGFHYFAPISSNCATDDTNCHQKHLKFGDHYPICIYGTQKNFGADNMTVTIPWISAYYYTPEGIRPLSHSYNFQGFCNDLYYSEIDEGGYLESVASSQYLDNNLIYALFTKPSDSIVRYEWPKSITPKEFSSEQIKKHVIKSENPIPRPLYLFNFIEATWGFSSADRKVYFSINNINPKSFTHFKALFKCPFNSSASFIITKREKGCAIFATKTPQSVFTVGTRVYHQVGQSFYVFIVAKNRFIYDKPLTQLFNQYFDTTQRVTGYSYKRKEGLFEVIIHGKRAYNYRRIGDYIFAIFLLNESYPILRPLQTPTYSDMYPRVTLGKAFIGIDGFLDYLGGMEARTPQTYVDIAIQVDPRMGQYRIMHSSIPLDVLRNKSTDRSSVVQYINAVDMDILPYERIIGIYCDDFDQRIYMVAHPKEEPEKAMIYLMSYIDTSQKHVVKLMSDFNPIKPWNSFCSEEASSLNKSAKEASVRAWNTIFVVLLILLLILSLLIALFVYQKNQNIEWRTVSQELKSEESETSRVKTLDKSNKENSMSTKSVANSVGSDGSDGN